MLTITTILGSVRQGNYTSKALSIVHDEIKKNKDVRLIEIDVGNYSLSFPGIRETESGSGKLQDLVSSATGIILATPEYHGSFSSVMKMVIENLGFPSVIKSKPVALLGVASGQIGATKSLEHLRSVCSHVGAIVLPGPVSVANVNKVFNAEGVCLEKNIEKRLRGLATNLLQYLHQHACPKIALEEMVRKTN